MPGGSNIFYKLVPVFTFDRVWNFQNNQRIFLMVVQEIFIVKMFM